jgi:hypothetical protein
MAAPGQPIKIYFFNLSRIILCVRQCQCCRYWEPFGCVSVTRLPIVCFLSTKTILLRFWGWGMSATPHSLILFFNYYLLIHQLFNRDDRHLQALQEAMASNFLVVWQSQFLVMNIYFCNGLKSTPHRVNRWSCKKIAIDVAQPIFCQNWCIIFTVE